MIQYRVRLSNGWARILTCNGPAQARDAALAWVEAWRDCFGGPAEAINLLDVRPC